MPGLGTPKVKIQVIDLARELDRYLARADAMHDGRRPHCIFCAQAATAPGEYNFMKHIIDAPVKKSS